MPRLTSEQKAARRLGIGASDVAELMGLSPYEGKSPVRLFGEKTGLLPDEEDEEESTAMKVGHALEAAVCAFYEAESGFRVKLSGEFVESVVHPRLSWARCNLDGRVEGRRAGLEIKIVGIGMMRDWDLESDDGIPPYVRLQAIWQMFVADLDEVHVLVLIGTAFRAYVVTRDEELERAAIAEVTMFWANVVGRIMPPLDGESTTKKLLEALYPPPPVDVEIEADDELAAALDKRVAAADAEKRAGEVKEIVNNVIRKAMGAAGATVAWSPSARATYSLPNKKGIRTLRVEPAGKSKEPRITKRASNVLTLPDLLDDGEVF